VPLQDSVVGAVATPMLMLLGAVGLVLLIACANVANLMLTRSSRRQQEMLVRLSLGATPGRLAGQVFVESAVLAAVAGVAGVFLASWSLRALVALAPSRLPRINDVAIDPMTILVAFGVTALAAVLFGLAPALHARRIGGLLARTAGRGGTASAGAMRLRNGLVAAEVAMAVVLLIGAGLLARTFWALQNVSPGFETTNLVTARVWLPRPNDSSQAVYLNPENRRAFMRAALDRVSALPGVTNAALTTQVPLGGYTAPLFFEIDGRTDVGTTARPVIHNFQVSPGYLETMGIPIRQGRAFDASDRAGSEPVAIVSAAAAERFWPGENPVGSRIRISPQAPWTTIVGVAGDVLHRRLDEAPQPILYRPLEQSSNLTLAFVVRTDGSQPGLPQALSEAVRAVDPALPVYAVRSMDELLARGVAQRQFLMRVLVAFGGAAVALALLGIYGVISYAVEQRTREIGIRIAIGARRVQVLGLVLRQGLGATLAGLAAGAAGAIGVARLIASQLYGVAPFDPLTIGGVMGLMLIVAALAILTPARRAANIDPIHALRREA
jgi:putative ABC transport system permease protein